MFRLSDYVYTRQRDKHLIYAIDHEQRQPFREFCSSVQLPNAFWWTELFKVASRPGEFPRFSALTSIVRHIGRIVSRHDLCQSRRKIIPLEGKWFNSLPSTHHALAISRIRKSNRSRLTRQNFEVSQPSERASTRLHVVEVLSSTMLDEVKAVTRKQPWQMDILLVMSRWCCWQNKTNWVIPIAWQLVAIVFCLILFNWFEVEIRSWEWRRLRTEKMQKKKRKNDDDDEDEREKKRKFLSKTMFYSSIFETYFTSVHFFFHCVFFVVCHKTLQNRECEHEQSRSMKVPVRVSCSDREREKGLNWKFRYSRSPLFETITVKRRLNMQILVRQE